MNLETPFLDQWAATVRGDGGVFLLQLPANTNLGPDAAGKVGARFQTTELSAGYVWILAPWKVQLEQRAKLGLEGFRENTWSVMNAPSEALAAAAAKYGVPVGALLLLLLASIAAAYVLIKRATK